MSEWTASKQGKLKMKRLSTITAIVVTLTATTATGQSLDDTAVQAAIKAGAAEKRPTNIPLLALCYAGSGFGAGMAASMTGGVQPTGGYAIVASRAAGRIAYAASDAKRLYKPFSVADVTQEMRNDSLLFLVLTPTPPTKLQNYYEVPSPLERVVVRSKDKPDAVAQPASYEATPVEWSNLMGGKIQGTNGFATFPLSAIRELPPGDLEVVAITAAGERRCKLSAKDRTRLF